MKQRIILLLTLCSMLVLIKTYPDSKGSHSHVSVEPHTTFTAYPIAPNVMEAFGWFRNGFTLENSSTACSFKSAFPVSCDVKLNGGLLNLCEDLIFHNHTSLLSSGSIYGNGHVISLCPSITSIPATHPTLLLDATLILNSNLILEGACDIKGNVTINGQGNVLSFGKHGYLRIREGATLVLQNITLGNIRNECLHLEATSSHIVLHNTRLNLTDHVYIERGSLRFEQDVIITGKHEFRYKSTQKSTIASFARLIFEKGTTFSYAPISNDKELLFFEDASAQLYLNGATLHAAPTGLWLDSGTMLVDNHVTLLCHTQHNDDLGIEIKHNFTVCILSAAVLDLQGCITLE